MRTSIEAIRSWLGDIFGFASMLLLPSIGGGLVGAAVIWLAVQGPSIVEAQASLDLSQEQRISNVAVTNGSATTFTNPLTRANFIQISLNPGDAQIFTYCPPQGGSCVQITSGLTYEIGPLRREIPYNQNLGTVQTATDSATLQIVAQRVN